MPKPDGARDGRAIQALPDILAKLRESAKRVTPQRRRILDVILSCDDHLDVEQIRARVSHQGLRVSTSTVYRTMRMLVEAGIITERHFEDGSARFEYVEEGEHHDHLICTRCGRVAEFTNETIEELQEVVARAHDFQMTGHRHEVYGICADCRVDQGSRADSRPPGVADE